MSATLTPDEAEVVVDAFVDMQAELNRLRVENARLRAVLSQAVEEWEGDSDGVCLSYMWAHEAEAALAGRGR